MHWSSKFAVLTRFITWFFMVRRISSVTPKVLTDWENMTFEVPTVRESGMGKDVDILWEDTIIALFCYHSVSVYCWTSTLWPCGCISAWTVQVHLYDVVGQIFLSACHYFRLLHVISGFSSSLLCSVSDHWKWNICLWNSSYFHQTFHLTRGISEVNFQQRPSPLYAW